MRRAVTLVPSEPARGEVLIPMVMARLGSSTRMAGSGRGSSTSVRVSPIVMSANPATATISPGPASSVSTRSRAFDANNSVTLPRCTDPSMRHHATVSPRRNVPLCTRQMARRPR